MYLGRSTILQPKGLYYGWGLGNSGPFDPSTFFSNGEQGAWYDPSDLTTLFQDAAGTTPGAAGSPVGHLLDKSGNNLHASQATTSARPTLVQSGDNYYLQYDGVDDKLTLTLASAFTGYLFIAGEKGSILEPVSFSAGAVDLGPLTYPGGTLGIFNAIGRIAGVVLIDRALTEDEQTKLVDFYKGKGAKGLLVEGPELVTNGTFDTNLNGWANDGEWYWEDGKACITDPTNYTRYIKQMVNGVSLGSVFVVELEGEISANNVEVRLGSSASSSGVGSFLGGTNKRVLVWSGATKELFIRYGHTSGWVKIDSISIKELRAEEDWA